MEPVDILEQKLTQFQEKSVLFLELSLKISRKRCRYLLSKQLRLIYSNGPVIIIRQSENFIFDMRKENLSCTKNGQVSNYIFFNQSLLVI